MQFRAPERCPSSQVTVCEMCKIVFTCIMYEMCDMYGCMMYDYGCMAVWLYGEYIPMNKQLHVSSVCHLFDRGLPPLYSRIVKPMTRLRSTDFIALS